FEYVADYPLLIAGVAFSVVLLKFAVNTGSLLVLKRPIRIVASAGLALSQIGEFSFVLERAGRLSGLSPAGMAETGSQIFIAVAVLLMILTPWLMEGGTAVGNFLARSSSRSEERRVGKECRCGA